ncbi:lycopene cyclase family protein [Haloactinomyces albus]|uniref:Lycopene beta-cyclase n=1 Tax=Haloactinomyces albus TaxID=1352928 RepID=A0AAE4CMI3_9ACTN|nr:lycopene cyclase family protein [Haloactinomyces albus]MDR7303415.1 lycopene beta-cyclase [Haloactinomyces albus]
MDVLVVGGGPAGRAVASSCSDAGMRVSLVDPAPRRGWPHTYAAWRDELPAGVAREALATVADRMLAIGTTTPHEWTRPYAVLDNTALWKHLWRADVTEVTGKVTRAEHGPSGSTVHLKDGRRLAAAIVVDASGAARVLSGGRPARVPAQQTAVGVVVDASEAGAMLGGGTAPGARTGVFMDWRPVPGAEGEPPTFLYVVPVARGRVLLEETSLARRPALPLAHLRRRLLTRLDAAGITAPAGAVEERVRFPVDDPLPQQRRLGPLEPRAGVVPFGTAAGMVHPATGFSVAASLRLAPWIAGALGGGLGGSLGGGRSGNPATAAEAAWSLLWPPSARAGHGLRLRALRALLSMPPHRVREFFEVFFALPDQHRWAFLAPEIDLSGTSAAMAAAFHSAPWSVRQYLLTGALTPQR